MHRRFFLGAVMGLLLAIPVFAAEGGGKPHIVFVTGDHEYSSEGTMPALAAELEKHFGFRTTVLKAHPDQNAEKNIPGLEALEKADLAVFYLRWRQLPEEQLAHIQKYLETGKPVIGFRTTTHAFNFPKGHPSEKWNAWAGDVFGAPPGWGADGHSHYGHDASTDVSVPEQAKSNPILKGVDEKFHVRSWLYKVGPKWPPQDATVLLMGKAVNPNRPAMDDPVAWTWKNKYGAKVLLTTIGHPDDFKVEAFQRFIVNGIHWAAGKPVPEKWPGKLPIDVAYHGLP